MAYFKELEIKGVVYKVKDEEAREELAGKQDSLTFDEVPQENSNNPVKSGGVYSQIADVVHWELHQTEIQTEQFDSQSDTVWNKPQVLSEAQKQTARQNIGAASEADTYTKEQVNSLIAPVGTEIQVVQALPATGQANTVYRVPGTGSYTDYGFDGTNFVLLTTFNGQLLYDELGQHTDGAMTQKAVADAIVSQIEKKEDAQDLAFTDESANAIVVFDKGHIKTKNFNSEEMANAAMSSDNQHSDLTFEDENGNAVVIFDNGHIKTKNFNSRNIVPNKKSDYEGMRISILGDSISTFGTSYEEGIEAAQANDKGDWTWVGNRCRYPQANLFVDVKYQYWHLLMEKLGLVLGVNESWAGSRISNTSETDTDDVGPNRHMASLTRIGHLGANGTPDIILVYGGTNDAGHNVEIGTFNTSNPKNLTENDIANLPVATFADAYRAMLIRLQYYYPYARIICLFPNFTTSYYSMTSLDDYEEIIREECDFFGVEYVDLRTAGVNFKNSSSYLTDGIHPNAEGMRLIYKRLLKTVFN